MSRNEVQVSVDLTELHRELSDSFDLEELRTLCFTLGIDYQNLPGEGKAAKARELVAYCERKGRILDLLEAYYEARPSLRPRVIDRPASRGSRFPWAVAGGLLLLGALISFLLLSPLSPISLIERRPVPTASLVGLRYVTDNFDPRSIDLRSASTEGISVYEDEALRLFDLAVLVPEGAPVAYRAGIEVYAGDERIGATETQPMEPGLIHWDDVAIENYIHGTYSDPAHWDVQPGWEALDVVVTTVDGEETVASSRIPIRLVPGGDAWFFGPPNLYLAAVVYSVNGGPPTMVDLRTVKDQGLGVEPGAPLTIEEVWYRSNQEGDDSIVQVEGYLSMDGFDQETFRATPAYAIESGIHQLPDVSAMTWTVPEGRESLYLSLIRSGGQEQGTVIDRLEIPLHEEDTP